jgi:hypothetical protein
VPGTSALVLSVDWTDPHLSEYERRLARARSDCDRGLRCSECGGGADGLPELAWPGQVRGRKIEHESDCGVGEDLFARRVVVPFWRRVGRPPRFALRACVVSPTFELEPVEVVLVADPRQLGMCLPTLDAFRRHWGIADEGLAS